MNYKIIIIMPIFQYVFITYVLCHGLCWYILIFGDTFSTKIHECQCIKYLFKTTKYCLQDLGYYSRSVLSNCALFIVMSMCISSVNLAFSGANLFQSLKREYERKTNPELSEMPGFIVSAITLSSIFFTLALFSFIILSSLILDIAYQVYNTEPCTECGINGYCSSKLKIKRDQETWKVKRRIHLFTSAFFGKEFANSIIPFDEDTVKFDLVYNKNETLNNEMSKINNEAYLQYYKPENIVVSYSNDKTL
ncbi:hypothetical protein BCR36DRAFT_416575 [Piromyces finnis]|uniref:Uncharacterized protein n=1 Tax=Piromyces finnis TaxID=1754191 RepID=A0A1Y1UUQ3_9FUNG|nr:hypothetical protein BCR36DRAFT_416575 [Piromyces finnis]|eukprot:ORX41765.1 hypothetical protein BCR36DRAFT_416575 [Piromyces finnis]